MSSSITSTLVNISQHITIYVGSIMLFAGVIGGLLNIIIFFTLQTFRKSASGFYLTIMSFVNIGNLLTGLLSRIIISGFEIDWTLTSPFYCKFRWYCLQFFILTSFTCTCLVAIDQYLTTSARFQWHQWNHIKIAHRLISIFILIWLLHGIPYLIYFNLISSSITNQITCTSVNPIYRQYHVYGYLITLSGVVPLIITGIFGLLAHHNIAHRAIPLVQRQLDKQLTTMVLNQLIYNFIFTSPYTILTITMILLPSNTDPILSASLNFVDVMSILLYYLSFAVSIDFVILS
jgi:hypothetical protein